MKDAIRLVGLSFYGYHGVTAAEKETGNQFEVDCEIETDLSEAGHTDRLTDTIDYAQVYQLIKGTVEGTAYSLLEALANHLATIILDRFPAYRVTLKVRKLQPPLAGCAKYIEIQVSRYQEKPSNLTNPTN
jgi:7,8-dihydroneopterin aldolase/epimerase/oxygenase